MDFYTSSISGTGNEYSTDRYKFYNFTLTVSSTVAMASAVLDDVADRFDQTFCAQLPQEVAQCFSFQYLLWNAVMSLRAENLSDSRTYLSKFQLIPFRCVIIANNCVVAYSPGRLSFLPSVGR